MRLLTPFDPVVWDRRRFELFWGWAYRVGAYTPAPKRKLGYYALPLLWGERVIGWGNVAMLEWRLQAVIGRASGKGIEPALRLRLDAERERFGAFMGASNARWARA
ncbi:hypothetical protein ASF44_15965 [Pseudorhodoferax sp. Leaf274]|nr:crosslink repair DNA glycosylase YcaQ family protein [Pseudorhodoferax sp. Leaf274]KQP37195.1 hypothetical protein ASF44_15965 [Pseudorhodoferax sp. Leaf274]